MVFFVVSEYNSLLNDMLAHMRWHHLNDELDLVMNVEYLDEVLGQREDTEATGATPTPVLLTSTRTATISTGI